MRKDVQDVSLPIPRPGWRLWTKTASLTAGYRAAIPWLLALVAGSAALVLYAATASPTITWRNGGTDSGELALAAWTLGVAHPPGYPTYSLLGRLAMLLGGPLAADPAGRLSLWSAAAGAATIAGVTALGWRLTTATGAGHRGTQIGSAMATVAAALTLATAPQFWTQATIPEVYTTAALWLVGLFALVACRRASHLTPRLWVMIGVVTGLGLGTHYAVGFALPGLAWVAWDGSGSGSAGSRRRLAGLGLGLIVGALIFAYLPIRAAASPPANWGNPTTLPRFVDLVTGLDYRRYVAADGLGAAARRFAGGADALFTQFGPAGVAAALIGLARLARERPSLLRVTAPTGLLSWLFATIYPVRDSEVYLLPLYLAVTVWLGLGIDAVARAGSRWAASGGLTVSGGQVQIARRAILVGIAAMLAFFAITPAVVARREAPRLSLAGDTEALDWARAALAAVAPRSVLITDGDTTAFPLWYAQGVLGLRPDVVLVDPGLLPMPWYRDQVRLRAPELLPPAPAPAPLRQIIEQALTHRALYTAVMLDPQHGLVYHAAGPVWRARRE